MNKRYAHLFVQATNLSCPPLSSVSRRRNNHVVKIYARKMAARAARHETAMLPPMVLAAPVKGVIGGLTGELGVDLSWC